MYAARMLASAPGFTAVGVISLTLGIGVCCVFYSEINSLVLRPLPAARHPEALVALETLSPFPYFERYRDQRGVGASTSAFVGPVPFSLALDVSAGTRQHGSSVTWSRRNTSRRQAWNRPAGAFSERT